MKVVHWGLLDCPRQLAEAGEQGPPANVTCPECIATTVAAGGAMLPALDLQAALAVVACEAPRVSLEEYVVVLLENRK